MRVLKVKDVVRILTDNQFRFVRQKGSHRQFEGRIRGQRRLVTVKGRRGDDIPRGTLSSIIRQSGLPRQLFR